MRLAREEQKPFSTTAVQVIIHYGRCVIPSHVQGGSSNATIHADTMQLVAPTTLQIPIPRQTQSTPRKRVPVAQQPSFPQSVSEKGLPIGDPLPFRMGPEGCTWPHFSSRQLSEIAEYLDAQSVLDNGTTVVTSPRA
jgi:hypothetical protein